ncbi:glycosyltransferase family 4 protein [Candidatus Bathyarchaeota archaeon]|nr:glycosyltransferase family 4 protein [Candidatus Bathyarchaeota archaeon]
MKVLMVTPYYFPTVGGTEVLIQNLAVKLDELGVTADILTFNFISSQANLIPFWRGKNENVDGVNVIKIPALLLLPWQMHSDKMNFMVNFIPGRFTYYLKNYDVIHFHNDVDLSFPLFSSLVKKPKILHCHLFNTTYSLYKRNFISRRILRNVADIYIAVSKYFVKLFVDLGVPETKVRLLPNGVDVNKFRPDKESKIEGLLLFVGRIEPSKGLLFLLKSLNYLAKPVQLVIIGSLGKDRSYNETIMSLIAKVNEKTIHKVVYLGKQRQTETIKWYQKASIFVLPSLSESFPLVNLEALACETPIVASNVGGIPEAVLNYKNGILISPGNVYELTQGIQYLLDNAKVRKRFGEEGRKLIMKSFSSEILMKRLLRIYNEVISL